MQKEKDSPGGERCCAHICVCSLARCGCAAASPPIPIFNARGVTATMEVFPDPMRPNIHTFRCTFSTSLPYALRNFSFQVSLPKVSTQSRRKRASGVLDNTAHHALFYFCFAVFEASNAAGLGQRRAPQPQWRRHPAYAYHEHDAWAGPHRLHVAVFVLSSLSLARSHGIAAQQPVVFRGRIEYVGDSPQPIVEVFDVTPTGL